MLSLVCCNANPDVFAAGCWSQQTCGLVALTCNKSPWWSTMTSPTTVSSTSTGTTWNWWIIQIRIKFLYPQNWTVWKVWPQGCCNQLCQEWWHQDLEVSSFLVFQSLRCCVASVPFNAFSLSWVITVFSRDIEQYYSTQIDEMPMNGNFFNSYHLL